MRGQSLEASVCTPLWSRLSSTLLQLMAELLGVRILQWFDRYRRLGPSLPLSAALIHHRGLHSDSVSAQDGEIQQELGAEVVVVGFYTLLDLISFSVERNLKGKKNKQENRTIMGVLLWTWATTRPQFTKSTTNGSTNARSSEICGWIQYVANTRCLVVRSRLALENWSDVEADRLDLPEESWSRTMLHNPLHLESQLLTILHWDGFTRRSWGRREGKLEQYTNPGQP